MSRIWNLLLVCGLAVVLVSPAALLLAAEPADETPAAVEPDEPKDEPKDEPAEEPDPFAVPETDDVAKLVAFIEDLQDFQPTSRREFFEFRIKGPAAMKEAAEKILSLEDDKKSKAHKLASSIMLRDQVARIADLDPGQQKQVLKKLRKHFQQSEQLDSTDFRLAITAAMQLDRSGSKELAAEAYTGFGGLFEKSDDKDIAELGARMVGAARRLTLVGNEMKVEGKTVDGKNFNWKSYRGKVVLIDFWATWCGPCRAEYPRVLQQYEKYHEHGFDVVGISIDEGREALLSYLEEQQVPWTNLHDPDAEGGHPTADYYGVFGIPTMILVDRDGKVVSTQARGANLVAELQKLFPDVKEEPAEEAEDAEKAPAAE